MILILNLAGALYIFLSHTIYTKCLQSLISRASESPYLPILSLTFCSPDIGASFKIEITLLTSWIKANTGTVHDIFINHI